MIFVAGNTNIPSGGALITLSKDVWKNPDHYLMDNFINSKGETIKNEREIDAYVAYIE